MRGGWDAKHVPSHWLDSFLCMCMRLLWEFRPGAHGAAVQPVSAFAPCCLLPVACWVFGAFCLLCSVCGGSGQFGARGLLGRYLSRRRRSLFRLD